MGKLSRTKGAEGEREVVAIFYAWGFHAKRSLVQSRSGTEACDVIVEGLPYWVEVKRGKKAANPYPALKQAMDAADGQPVMVIGRADRSPTIVSMYVEDFMELLRSAYPGAWSERTNAGNQTQEQESPGVHPEEHQGPDSETPKSSDQGS